MKLFASDFDGTIAFMHVTISKENKQAVLEWQKEHLFGFATGRDYFDIKRIAQNEGIDADFFIAFNGAYVVEKEGKVIIDQRIDTDFHLLFDYLSRHTSSYVAFGLNHKYVKRKWRLGNMKRQLFTRLYSYKKKDHRKRIKSIDALYRDLPFQISCLVASSQKALSLASYINNHFPSCYAMANDSNVDIVPRDCDKGNGVDAIVNYFGIDQNDVYVAGDNYNDIDMLKRFHGFAMKSGKQAAKEAANDEINEVHEAIYQILNHETN